MDQAGAAFARLPDCGDYSSDTIVSVIAIRDGGR
jgi:hypothetical protein